MNGDSDKKLRPRSPEFPYLALPEALAKLQKLIDTYEKHPARLKLLAPLWGFQPSSSSFLRNVAALRTFGLVDETGSGDERKIAVSELGMKIARDKRPGARESYIQKAFQSASILNEYRSRWGARRPPDQECLSELTLDNGFTEVAARRFLLVYDETLAYVEKAELNNSASPTETSTSDETKFDVGMFVQWEQSGVLKLPKAARLTGFSPDGAFGFVDGSNTGIPKEELIKADPPTPEEDRTIDRGGNFVGNVRSEAIEATYSLPEGQCTLIYPSGLSEKSARRLKRWLDLMLEDVAELADPND